MPQFSLRCSTRIASLQSSVICAYVPPIRLVALKQFYEQIIRPGDHFVPNDSRFEHGLEEPDRGTRIRSEDVGVVEANSHDDRLRNDDAER